jgi:dihydroorotate dehydrogenase (NAD+) catalytic subunit
MIDLHIEVGGLSLKNPLLLASCGLTSNVAGLKRQIGYGYGAVVTKTVTVTALKGAPQPTVFWYDRDEKNLLSGVEGLKNPGIDQMADAVEQAGSAALQEDCKIIGSCTANTVEEAVALCTKLQAAGAHGIELNMVCPNTGPHLGKEYSHVGRWWASDAEKSVKLIRGVKEVLQIPIWAKLPLVRLIDKEFLDRLSKEAKPDAYSFVGGRLPNLKIDVVTGKPVLPGNLLLMIQQKIPICPMVTGPVKPSTVLHAAYLSKLTDIPLVCSGGLTKGEDVLEVIMAGASAAQVCKIVYREKRACDRIMREIEAIMRNNEYNSIESLRGRVLRHLPAPPLFTVPGSKGI